MSGTVGIGAIMGLPKWFHPCSNCGSVEIKRSLDCCLCGRCGTQLEPVIEAVAPPAVVSDRPPCRVCRCTNQAPCIPPCMWIVDGVCSTCLTAANALADWMLEAHKPRTLALIAEAKILFDRAIELSRLSRKAGE